jgi:hypothetical protein
MKGLIRTAAAPSLILLRRWGLTSSPLMRRGSVLRRLGHGVAAGRRIVDEPHPVGSAVHDVVRDRIVARFRVLGYETQTSA